jgi:hypothetical protein
MLVEHPLAHAQLARRSAASWSARRIALVASPGKCAFAYSNFRIDRAPRPVAVRPGASTLTAPAPRQRAVDAAAVGHRDDRR